MLPVSVPPAFATKGTIVPDRVISDGVTTFCYREHVWRCQASLTPRRQPALDIVQHFILSPGAGAAMSKDRHRTGEITTRDSSIECAAPNAQ
jgi:hypothetical protein